MIYNLDAPRVECAKALLRGGADPNYCNKAGGVIKKRKNFNRIKFTAGALPSGWMSLPN